MRWMRFDVRMPVELSAVVMDEVLAAVASLPASAEVHREQAEVRAAASWLADRFLEDELYDGLWRLRSAAWISSSVSRDRAVAFTELAIVFARTELGVDRRAAGSLRTVDRSSLGGSDQVRQS